MAATVDCAHHRRIARIGARVSAAASAVAICKRFHGLRLMPGRNATADSKRRCFVDNIERRRGAEIDNDGAGPRNVACAAITLTTRSAPTSRGLSNFTSMPRFTSALITDKARLYLEVFFAKLWSGQNSAPERPKPIMAALMSVGCDTVVLHQLASARCQIRPPFCRFSWWHATAPFGVFALVGRKNNIRIAAINREQHLGPHLR